MECRNTTEEMIALLTDLADWITMYISLHNDINVKLLQQNVNAALLKSQLIIYDGRLKDVVYTIWNNLNINEFQVFPSPLVVDSEEIKHC